MKQESIKTHISVIFAFFSIGLISLFFVPTHDDLIDLSCHSFLESFSSSLTFGNGRFLGNTLVRVLLNNTIMDSVFRTIIIGGIIVLSALLVTGNKSESIMRSYLLYIGVGLPIFIQVFVWGHGFYNYAPPVFFLFLSLFLLKCYHKKNNKVSNIIYAISVLFASFIAQLFAENSTTINFLISLLILILAFKQRTKKLGAILLLIGSTLGLICMFLGPKLFGVSDKLADYRSVSSTFLSYVTTAMKNTIEILNTLSTCWGLWLFLSIILICLLKQKSNSVHWFQKILLISFLPISIIQNFITSYKVKSVIGIIFCVYLTYSMVILIKLFDKNQKLKMLPLMGITLLSIAQLLIVSPIGPRCLFISYSLLSLWMLDTINEIDNKILCKRINKCIVTINTIVFALLLLIYIQSWTVHCARMDYGFKQLSEGKTHIEIIELPHECFFHCPNESYVYNYTFNHGNKDDMNFSFISYDEFFDKQNITN